MTSIAAARRARAAAGDKYVNVLGASIARQCLDAGLLDEIFVRIAPVLLGDGVRLFDQPGGAEVSQASRAMCSGLGQQLLNLVRALICARGHRHPAEQVV